MALSAGSAQSPDFPTTEAGAYRWIATYNGDDNNEQAAGGCDDAGETSTVAKATPTLSTSASDATIGAPIHDTATISGGYNPGGTVTFRAFGPGDTACAISVFESDPIPVSGGTAVSGDFTPPATGAYRWIATYSGNGDNEQFAGGCGDAGETSTVDKATPTLATNATDTTIGGTIHDTATVSGGHSPGGTVTFEVFAPGDATCSSPLASDDVTLGTGSAQSPDFTTAAAGAYHWIATYNGDDTNNSVAGTCGDTGETSIVAKATPSLSTSATDTTIGGSIHDTATISGGHGPTGTVSFNAYAAADASCATPVFSSGLIPVSGGTAVSGDFTPTVAGTYRWKAIYSGDDGNSSVAGNCTDPGETSTVSKFITAMTTVATDADTVGGSTIPPHFRVAAPPGARSPSRSMGRMTRTARARPWRRDFRRCRSRTTEATPQGTSPRPLPASTAG